eukprot:5489084-Alexandrium_andersonii.AAC.1
MCIRDRGEDSSYEMFPSLEHLVRNAVNPRRAAARSLDGADEGLPKGHGVQGKGSRKRAPWSRVGVDQ